MNKLPRDFYTRSNVLEVARDLLGKKLVVPNKNGARVAGIIVETEAYRGPEDRASHAYNGRRTNRTETMYGIGGTAYVYFVYGMYNQFNVVTGMSKTCRMRFWCARSNRLKGWTSCAAAAADDLNMN